MEKLHGNIKRLSNDVTNSIDDISKYISMQYMKKKNFELRQKRDMYQNGGNQGSFAQQMVQPRMGQMALQQHQQMDTNSNLPPIQQNRMARGLSNHEDSLNSDLFNSHAGIHNYGKIETSAKNFESLSRKAGDRNELGQQGSQQYQPL